MHVSADVFGLRERVRYVSMQVVGEYGRIQVRRRTKTELTSERDRNSGDKVTCKKNVGIAG